MTDTRLPNAAPATRPPRPATTSPPPSPTSTRARTSASRWRSSRPTPSPATTAQRGDDVDFLTGTDENSLKNVQAAEAEGIADARAGRRATPRRSRSWRALLNLSLRRLHPHQRRPAPPGGRAEALGGLRRPRRHLPAALPRPLLRRLRAVLHAGRTAPDGLCPEHLTQPEVVEEENYFFRLSRYGDRLLRADRVGRAADRARDAAQRGAQLHPQGAGGLQHLALAGARPRLGHPGARRPRPGDVRLVRRADQLHHRARLRHRRRSSIGATGLEPRRVHAIGKGSCASTPSTGRRCCSRPGVPPPTTSSSTAT